MYFIHCDVYIPYQYVITVMPAKSALFNHKCEPIFDFGTSPKNCVYYNPLGSNILCLHAVSSSLVLMWYRKYSYFLYYDLYTVYSMIGNPRQDRLVLTLFLRNKVLTERISLLCSLWIICWHKFSNFWMMQQSKLLKYKIIVCWWKLKDLIILTGIFCLSHPDTV